MKNTFSASFTLNHIILSVHSSFGSTPRCKELVIEFMHLCDPTFSLYSTLQQKKPQKTSAPLFGSSFPVCCITTGSMIKSKLTSVPSQESYNYKRWIKISEVWKVSKDKSKSCEVVCFAAWSWKQWISCVSSRSSLCGQD